MPLDSENVLSSSAVHSAVQVAATALIDVLDRDSGTQTLSRAVVDLATVVGTAAAIEEARQFYQTNGALLRERVPRQYFHLAMELGRVAMIQAQHPPTPEQRRSWADYATAYFADAEEVARALPDDDPMEKLDFTLRASVNRSIAATFQADSERELSATLRLWAKTIDEIPRGDGSAHFRDPIVSSFLQVIPLALDRLAVSESDRPAYRLQQWRIAGGDWFDELDPAQKSSSPAPWSHPLVEQERDALRRVLTLRANGHDGTEPTQHVVVQVLELYLYGLMANVGFPPALLAHILPTGFDADDLSDLLGGVAESIPTPTGAVLDPVDDAELARLRLRARVGHEATPGEYRAAATRIHQRDATVFGFDLAADTFTAQLHDLIRNGALGDTAADAADGLLNLLDEHRDLASWSERVAAAARSIESRAAAERTAHWIDLIARVRQMMVEAPATRSLDTTPSWADQVRAALARHDALKGVDIALAGWRDPDTLPQDRIWIAQFLIRLRAQSMAPDLTADEYRALVREVYLSIDLGDLAMPGMVDVLAAVLEQPQSLTGMTDTERDDLAERTRRAYAASPRRDQIPYELRALLLPPTDAHLAVTLRAIEGLRDERGDHHALAMAMQGLMRLMNGGSLGAAGFAEVHQTARRLQERHSTHPDARVRNYLMYLVGETARRAGDGATATAWQSQIADPNAREVTTGIEADFALLALSQTLKARDLDGAHFWLDRIHRFTEQVAASDDRMLVNLGGAVAQFCSVFGLEEVRKLATRVQRDLANLAARSTGVAKAKAQLMCCEILLAEKGDAREAEVFDRLTDVLDTPLPGVLEAQVRRTRVRGEFVARSNRALQEDLDRLVHLQDQALRNLDRGNPYEDVLGDIPRGIALTALQHGDVDLAIDALERGRMRHLFQLHATGGNGKSGQRLYDQQSEEFFIPLSPTEVLEWAKTRPIVYEFTYGSMLTLLGIGPEKVSRMTLDRGAVNDQVQLNVTVQRFWSDLLKEPASMTVPVMINYGLTPWELVALDRTYTSSHSASPMRNQLPHLPTARFLNPAAAPTPAGPPQLLHVGDGTDSLIGPWLEAAYIRATYPGDATTVTGSTLAPDELIRPISPGATLIASCHGSFADSGDHFRLGLTREGVSLSELFAQKWFSGYDNVFLAACDSGSDVEGAWERDSLSAANAALVGGAQSVLAPASPINDLVSAFVVCAIVDKLPMHEFGIAVNLASAEVMALTPEEFRRDLETLWDCLWSSDLIDQMPWPPALTEAAFWRIAADTIAQQAWRSLPLILLDGHAYSASSGEAVRGTMSAPLHH
jgi:hypothetical protein